MSSHRLADSSGNEDNNKESNEPGYDYDDEKSDKEGEEKQEHDTGKITMTSTPHLWQYPPGLHSV